MQNLKNNMSDKDKLINQNIGKWIRTERKKLYRVIDGQQRPTTQSMVANKLGVTFQQIQKYEKGINTLPIFRWFALCDYFSVEPNTVKELVTSKEVVNITETKQGDSNDNNDVCPKE